MSKKDEQYMREIKAINNLWKSSYKKLEQEYEDLLTLNGNISVELEQVKNERKLWFEKALHKTEMLDTVYDAVKDYRTNEHLYGVKNGTMQSWFNS